MSRKTGFTLIEMLVVLAVIATICAVLFPVFGQAREKARQSTCLSNLHQLGLAHQLYVQDYDDVLPFWWGIIAGRVVLWPEFLLPYYGDRRLLDQNFPLTGARADAGWLADYAMVAWGPGGTGTEASPYYRWPGSYSYSANGVGRPMALAEVRRPGETLQFTDGFTGIQGTATGSKHANGVLNGAFLDGCTRRVSMVELERVDHDAWGYFYRIAAADR